MRYIDAEKLIAEIKRQKHELELSIQSQGDYGQSCHIVAYDNSISLIDSLQQEQPEVDLEKEYQEFCKDYPFPWSSQYVNREYIDELCLSVARHFYELGLKAKEENRNLFI